MEIPENSSLFDLPDARKTRPVHYLALDAWLASSLLQKAIRRSEVELAERAALTLWRQRGPRIWRRLVVIAVEDVGLGALHAVMETVRIARAMTSTARNRPVIDPVQTLFSVTRMLAEAPKDRSTDYLFSMAVMDASLNWFRSECLRLPASERIALATDPEMPLNLRAVVSWTASGLVIDGAMKLDRGDRAGLFRAYREVGIPDDLVRASADAATMTREPISLFLPLLWQAWTSEGASTRVTDETVPETPSIGGVPAWSADSHTRAGKIAIARFARENTNVHKVLAEIVEEKRVAEAAYMGAFYLDASPVRKRLDWPLSRQLERDGRLADMATVGVPWDSVEPILEAMRTGYDQLNARRIELIRQAISHEQ